MVFFEVIVYILIVLLSLRKENVSIVQIIQIDSDTAHLVKDAQGKYFRSLLHCYIYSLAMKLTLVRRIQFVLWSLIVAKCSSQHAADWMSGEYGIGFRVPGGVNFEVRIFQCTHLFLDCDSLIF